LVCNEYKPSVLASTGRPPASLKKSQQRRLSIIASPRARRNMTEALLAPRDGASYFFPSSLHHSSRQRMPSLNASSPYITPPPTKPSFHPAEYSSDTLDSNSAPSSVPSSPPRADTTFPKRISHTSTLANGLSPASEENDGETGFPSFQRSRSLSQLGEVWKPAPRADERDAKPMITAVPAGEALQSGTKPKDDQAIEREPVCHADYLAHEWKLEDIWSSWRYVVARRKVYSNSVRLENASWRTWAKVKGNLKTISPESINW
jgi:hypothetical protein